MAGKVKPRFKVGQVVCVSHMQAWVKIKRFSPIKYLGKVFRDYEVVGLDETCPTMGEDQLRPLTAREKGAARK